MRTFKRCRNLFNLTTRFLGAKIDRSPDRHRAHIECLLHTGIQRLIKGIRVAERFVVVNFYEERNTVCIATRYGSQHAVGRRHAVTARFDS
ncbi:hypothetical protein D3C81_1832810 [compost metagenome]